MNTAISYSTELISVSTVVSTAVKKSDLDRLLRLKFALSVNRSVSHYAQMSDSDLTTVIQIVDDALALLTPAPRKRRVLKVKKAPAPALQAVDVSPAVNADLFADLKRWPKRPYCTQEKESGLRIRSLSQAVKMRYIQPNLPHIKFWSVFDIDNNNAADAWKVAGLPPPTWTAINEENGHAHCAWGLRTPVLVSGLGARDAPMRYLASIESMMREKLFADSGYSGLITKNPSDLVWRTSRGPQMYYGLDELAACLPGIEKYILKRKETEVGSGRNVALFDRLRKWAYVEIRQFWKGASCDAGLKRWNAWLSQCNSRALVYNSDFPIPLGGKEVWHSARSVARWTWQHTTEKGFSDWQSAQGRKGGVASGKARLSANEDKRASARLMRAAGQSSRQICSELGVDQSTVVRWLKS